MRVTASWLQGAVRNLGWHTYRIAASTERLSSGLRINGAADDPGSLGVGIRFATQMRSIRTALRNITMGQSLLGTADAALGQVHDLLQRGRQLAVSASNGTLTDSARAAAHAELTHLRLQIDTVLTDSAYNGHRLFGTYGPGIATLYRDSLSSAAGLASTTNTGWQNGRVTLGYATQQLFSDSFGDLSQVDTGATTAVVNTSLGAVSSPQALAAVISDTFASLAKLDPGLTTAFIDTLGGLVRLSRTAIQLAGDSFTGLSGTNAGLTSAVVDTAAGRVTQGLTAEALFSDSFGDLSGIDSARTSAVVDALSGSAYLSTSWAGALTGNPGWQLSQTLNQRFFDTFADLTGTFGAATTAVVDIAAGAVSAPAAAASLWGESPGFRLSGSAPAWITVGTDTFSNLVQVSGSTGLSFDTVAGVVGLLTETFTVGADTFTGTGNLDTVRTTAMVDTAAGQVRLNANLVTESYGDSFNTAGNVLSASGVTVDTASSTAALSTSLTAVQTETFADASALGAGSSNVAVEAGDLRLGEIAQYNNKQNTTGVFRPGTGSNGNFDSRGLYSSSVVDLGNGTLRMYYATGKQSGGANYTIGYTESTDGGQTWTSGTNLNVTGVNAGTEVNVTRDASTGTYYMFYSDGTNIYRRTSATGTSGWSAPTAVVSAGSYTGVGRPSITVDAGGTYHMFLEVNNGGTRQIEHLTASSLGGSWADVAGWTNLNGAGPEIVNEGAQFALYYTDNATGRVVRRTSADLNSISVAADVISQGSTGFDRNAVKTGGAVFDSATGTTRMLYLGRASATGEWAAGLAYTTARAASGTFRSTVTNTTDTIQNLTLNATESLNGGTITYKVSTDGGLTWSAVSNGGNLSVAAGKQVMLEATLSGTNGGPRLQDFTLSSNLYQSSGQLTSTVYNFSRPVDNLTLSTAAATPAGTAISYQYSLDGTTWQAFTPGSRVDLGTTATQVQVRANFSTADRGYTATLSDYAIAADYTQYNATEYLYTQNYTFTDSIDRFDLSAAQSGSVAWEYSTDGGTNWQAAGLGSNALAGAVQQLQLRARLDAGGGGATTPTISDYSITASRYEATGSFTSTDYTFASPVNEVRLNAAETTPGGGAISYEVSTDGGTSWQAISNGGTLSLASPTTAVRMRASIASGDQYYTPTLADYTLEGYTTGYKPAATYTSGVHTFGYNVRNVTLNVAENTPAGTGIDYQISTDGGLSWQAVTPGSNIDVTPGMSLMLRANLSTSDPSATPELISYSLETEQQQSGAVWQSVVTGLSTAARAVRLTAAETILPGTGISYAVSGDGGSTWTSVTPGSIVNLGTPGNQLAVRATFSSSDPYAAASLAEIKLETYDHQTSGTFTSGFQSLSGPTTQVRLDSAAATLPAGTGISYQVTNDGGATWMAIAPGAAATFASAGSQIGFRAVMTSDGSATPTLSSFALSVPGYSAAPQYVYSSVRSFGYDVTNVTLNVNENRPAGTGMQYEVSTDGGSTWTAVTAGSNSLVPAGRDLAFRARLSSSAPDATPALLDYSLTTNRPAAGAEWVSAVTSTGSNVSRVRLNVAENKPAGTSIQYQISTDGGSSFQAITPGSFVSVAPGNSMVLKAVFSSSNPSGQTAALLDYNLETEEYAGPQQFVSRVTDIGHDVTELKLDVNQTLPGGTGITYELSNDGGASWAAVTPGSTATFAGAGRDVVMRATLTGTAASTPELLDYTISAPSYATGMLYSSLQSFASPVSNITLNASSATPAGTGIKYEISTDNGASWRMVTPGANTQLASPASQLIARATFTSTDGRKTAELFDWSLETASYHTSGEAVTTLINLPMATDTLRLRADVLLNGGAIDFVLSNDGGATWVSVANDGEVTFAGAGSQVLLRASFSGLGGASGPEWLGYALEGETDRAPVTRRFELQAGPNAVDRINLELPWISVDSLDLDQLDIATQEGAGAALDPFERAIGFVSAVRGSIGATMNALEATYARQAIYEEAMAGAASRVMDADMARETLDLVRSQLLLQTDAKVLAAGLDFRRSAVSSLLGALPGSSLVPGPLGSKPQS